MSTLERGADFLLHNSSIHKLPNTQLHLSQQEDITLPAPPSIHSQSQAQSSFQEPSGALR